MLFSLQAGNLNLKQYSAVQLTPLGYKKISRGREKKAYPHQWCVALAWFISAVIPARHWYKAALKSTLVTASVLSLFRKNKPAFRLTRANHLNRLLSLLTRTDTPFHIPYRNYGMEILHGASGTIFCSVHLPLAKVSIRAMVEQQIPINAAITGARLPDGKMSLFGSEEKIPAIFGDAFVLVKAKKVLDRGGNVILMIDRYSNDKLSPNIMHFCGKIDARMVFYFSHLKRDGIIDNIYTEAPYPGCKNETEIKENIAFLKRKTAEIIAEMN